MGHKHSKRPSKPKIKHKSLPEVTEIFEFNDSQSEIHRKSGVGIPEAIKYPVELERALENMTTIESSIEEMTQSQINLFYATLKDDLHNNWRRIYDVKDADAAIKDKKVETIERVKRALRELNDRVLIKK